MGDKRVHIQLKATVSFHMCSLLNLMDALSREEHPSDIILSNMFLMKHVRLS